MQKDFRHCKLNKDYFSRASTVAPRRAILVGRTIFPQLSHALLSHSVHYPVVLGGPLAFLLGRSNAKSGADIRAPLRMTIVRVTLLIARCI